MGTNDIPTVEPDEQYTSVLGRLTAFQTSILLAIPRADEHPAGDAPHGLAVKQRIERDYGTEINHGRLYPNLHGLEEAGLLEQESIDDRTNAVRLTDAGRDALTNLNADVGAALHAADAEVAE